MKQLPPQPPPKMGDFYDPEHPTPELSWLDDNREEENEAKIENVQKTGFIKGPMFKGVASSRFLPKGTKTKVNLEEQGRQKVSFSFSLTKKTLQNRFLTALGSEKQNDTPNSPVVPLQVDSTPKIKMDIGDTLSTTEESSPPKSRVELGKIHFKKHLLHVTSRPLLTSTTAVASPSPPIVPLPAVIAESTTVDSPPSSPPPPPPPPQATTPSLPAPVTEPVALPHTPVTVLMTAPVDVAARALKEPPVTIVPESSEVDTKQDPVSNSSEEHITHNLNEQADIPSQKEDSHIGKEEEIPDSSKSSLGSKKTGSKKKSSQSEGTFLGSESDEDSVRTSSSQRSHDLKFSANIEKERDSKKSLATLKSEDLGKSSRSKTERDDKYFSYSKLERDTRYISSRCRSERERRRSRSRSRSDRGSRTSSSYSRSERSHYYDSDRRYHRSSPYRERARYSRPYTDNRARESSDSEDEYKKTYSRRTSSHSSSYRDLRTPSSYSKSDRDCKTESSYLEMEKRGKYSSKLERESKRTSENEAMKRCCSPTNELGFRRGSSYSKHGNSASRYKSAPSKPAPKSDKFKNSFCCTELNEEIKQSHSFSLQTPCSKGSELRMISKVTEREKIGSPSPSNRLNDSPTFKKLDESPVFKSEFIGHDSHDSIKELDSLCKVKNDQLRSYCPTEFNINGSPGAESDLATFCTSKRDTVLMSSDDSVTGSEVSPLVKTCMLSSNGFQNINRCKEKDLDDTRMQHSKSESPFRETEPPVSPHQDQLISLPVMTIDYSKTVVKEPVDVRVSCCKTKDSDIYCTSNDSRPSFCHSGAENTEPLVTKISSNSFMNMHLKSKTVICDNGSLTDQHSKFACGEYKQSVGSTSSASINHFDDLYQPTGSSCIASSLQSLPPGIKVDSLTLLQCGENTSSVLDAVLKSKSSEFLKHAEKEIIEVGSGLPDSGRGFASWENRHNNGLSGKCVQEAQEEGNSILPDRRGRPEISLDEEGGRGHAHTSDDSEVVFSSCDLNLIMEDSDGVTYTLKCDSSGHASEIVSTVHEDYSGSSESSSDESDSEDTDSDDSSIPRNRLQSVVVVPKNSTLPMEETSPCSSRSSQSYRHYSDHWEDERLEPRRHSYEEKFESIASKACPQTEKFFFHKATEKNSEISFIQPSRKQIDNHMSEIAHPQSDGVDSTSHTDIKSDPLGHPNSEEAVKARITSRQQEELPVYSSDDFEDVSSKSRQQTTFANRPDSRLGKTESNFSSCEISRVDGFRSSEELRNLGWDFSQQEKPTTTYQQPDSSYGACGGHKYQQSAEQYSGTRNYWQGNGYWDPRSAGRPPGTGVVYDRIQGQVPDSLTDDREEEENWDQRGGSHFSSQSNKFFLSLQKDKGSVQAPEISSNSIKDSLAVNEKKDLLKNLEKNDMKDRGPLKKRRQELESDSESDGELQDRKKVRVEVEQGETAVPLGSALVGPSCVMEDFRDPQRWKECAKQGKMPCYFDLIEENVYLTERKKNKSHRDIKRMQCECTPLSKDERAQGEIACGEDCLNRLLMIECSSRCPNGDYCSNRRFQRKQHADVEVILTEKKGWGLRAAKDLPSNTFVLEYCGEVLDHKEFKARVKEYARNKNIHYYFMALKNDEIIDATQKGNCSRFMNHSCEPNCETQKWTVNGQLRVGFFTTKLVPSGSELTFDYQFQRYGKEAQKCFCGSANCRGYLGGENRVSIRAAGGKMKKERSRKKDSVDGELEALMENGEGLSDKNQVLSLSRLMVRIETLEQKLTCLKLIQNTHSQSCLKSFLERHGLSLLWIWMAELGDGRESNQKLQEEEVYRIPKKSQTEKESTITERGRDAVGFRDQTVAPKTPNRSRERDPDKQTQNKEKRKRRGSLSPPSSAYERGTKRPDDRYDTPTSKKKVRIKDRNKLSTEERRKLFEQEVAQREAQKQQQQMQNLGMTSPLPYDSLGYSAPHHPFAGYPPGYPMQAYVDPSNPNAGKVLLPTPSMDPVCSPAPYDHSQPLVGHSTEPLAAPPPVPVVPHVAAPVEVSSSQYVAQSDGVVHQDSSVTVLPVPAPGPVQGQNYGVWDSNQQSVSVQQQYSPAQSQATIYYQGQACPTVYGVTSPYSQTTPPIVQSYAQPSLQYIQGQQIFTAHPQGVVVQPATAVTTIVAPGQPQPLQPPEMVVTNNLLDLPPPSPPKPKTIVLPPNWKTARDPEGKIYYYHVITRQTQWDPPTWESPGDDASLEHEAEMDLGTPTYDENPMKTSKKPKTAEADTSSELAKKSKEVFRKEMSQFIVQCLNPYRKPDCKVGRITTTEDFKHLARKLTHGVMNKELKYCKNPEDLECNENVKHKTKEYIKKYMQKFGAVYKPKEDTELE
ncbi:histone-lysine N-methyltransferase SETD2 isoform X5 [Tursiops truncatus]|uniref:[histone H3]-lysine(36) N-trimethyltransferase n=1 Tax=Tursiops truncatus TaxID=9739 RepID=A0A6J3S2H1_TURTR|nr:histone-lysine N-methyltransferase SETD2 isoform X3 [Tursiops truncatus]